MYMHIDICIYVIIVVQTHTYAQGNGTLGGILTADLDGGEPFSNAVFSKVSISRIGLYTLQVSSDSESAVSTSIQVRGIGKEAARV